MNTTPDPDPVPVRRRRVDRPKGRKAIPTGVKILAAVCMAILIMIPVAKQEGWIGKRQAVTQTAQESSYKPGLGIAEAALDPKSRTIKGIVENLTDKIMDDVQVSYEIRDRMAELVAVPVVKIGSLKPKETAKFETEKLPPSGTQWYMHSLSGTPR